MSKKKNKHSFSFGAYEKDETKIKTGKEERDTSFSFRYVCNGEHAFDQCTYSQLKSATDKLRILSNLSWSVMSSSPRTTNGFEEIAVDQISRALPNGIPKIEKIMIFRFGGGSGSKNSGRIAGYRRGDTFYILYIDSKLDLYSHS